MHYLELPIVKTVRQKLLAPQHLHAISLFIQEVIGSRYRFETLLAPKFRLFLIEDSPLLFREDFSVLELCLALPPLSLEGIGPLALSIMRELF
jgi:hypothetical protein